jgi:HAD superfamily hydrolase (TIGR01509 family)
MAKLEALLFDVDGTLADTERDAHRVAFNSAFSERGLDWDWSVERYGELLAITGGKERIQHYIDNYLDGFLDGYLEGHDDESDLAVFIRELHASKTAFYKKLLSEGAVPLRNGVARLLSEARERSLRLAIVTTTTPENVEVLLSHTLGAEAMGWFDVIAAGDIVPAKKPAPDIYFYAMQQLGLRAEHCLAFEDSENGIRSACDAGLKTVVTVNEYTKAHDFTGAALVIDQLGEPDVPFQVLSGEVGGNTFFNVALAEYIYRQA